MREVGELSPAELEALVDAAREKAEADSWGNPEELLATIVDLLQHIVARLDRGIPVGMVEKLGKFEPPKPITRPKHVERAQPKPQSKKVSPAELMRFIP